WRVTADTSLFDYSPGSSTETFAMKSWPLENPPCVLQDAKPVRPASLAIAERACQAIRGRFAHSNCTFDVRVTGNPGFAKTYLLSQRIRTGSTRIFVSDDKHPTRPDEPVTFTAMVTRIAPGARGVPTGAVQFMLDGETLGDPVKLDAKSQARWKTQPLRAG